MIEQVLKIDNQIVDIDDKSAIGIDFQAYSVKEPASRFVPVSNNISLPKTARNLKILGFAGDPQSAYSTVYDQLLCDYTVSNHTIINKGIANISSVSKNRIKMFASGREGIWQRLKNDSWIQFQADFIQWMQDNKGLPSGDNTFSGTFSDFIDPYTDSTTGIILPMYVGNLYLAETDPETIGVMKLQTNESLGGHFCVYVKTIFEFIEDFYGVDFSVLDTFDYNIFDDSIAQGMYVSLRNLQCVHADSNTHYFRFTDSVPFLPEADVSIDKEDKTLYDFVMSFMQHFNCLVDRVYQSDGTLKYKLRRFDDINNAEIVTWNKGIGDYVFMPKIKGWKQNNYIKWSDIYEGGSSLVNSKYVQCKNENIEAGTAEDALFTIGGYIPNQLRDGDTFMNLSDANSFNNFTFMISSELFSTQIDSETASTSVSATKLLNKAVLYSLDSEYNTLASMMEYPVYYDSDKWFNFQELINLEYFKRYKIPELGGEFFLNKISNYNPSGDIKPTKIELIKIQ